MIFGEIVTFLFQLFYFGCLVLCAVGGSDIDWFPEVLPGHRAGHLPPLFLYLGVILKPAKIFSLLNFTAFHCVFTAFIQDSFRDLLLPGANSRINVKYCTF